MGGVKLSYAAVLFFSFRGVTEEDPPSHSERTEIKNTYVLYDNRRQIIYLYVKMFYMLNIKICNVVKKR